MSLYPSGTVTFLFTDIEGSTKLAQKHPDIWEKLRDRHHAILQSAMEEHKGCVFQIIGDGFCVAFHTARDGLSAAADAQHKLQHEDWGKTPIKVRMGLHTGSAELIGSAYRGYLTLAKVQRVMSVACGGQGSDLRILDSISFRKYPFLSKGTSADKRVPEPVQYPHTWGRDDLICVDPNKARYDSDRQYYNQSSHQHPPC